ncbi:MAG TPA: hypothetical protein VFX23_09585 [Limnobacter sp.]|uniref:hypothetical protein n=1 Tax=Limnobacter sp. TaxID=2003368 RepID=UPI002E325615|nr:hypothetical protein [Limnobacter sp.]HEX5486239.1 hypothetical protein [Limnobacter sp.]
MPVTSTTSNSDASSVRQSSHTVSNTERDSFAESVLNMAKALADVASRNDSASIQVICGTMSKLLTEGNPYKRGAQTERSTEAANSNLLNRLETGNAGAASNTAELAKVNSDIDALGLPADFAAKFKKCVRLAAEEIGTERDSHRGSIEFEIKSRALNLLMDEPLDDEHAKAWVSNIKNALPEESLSAVQGIQSEVVRIRAEGLFSLLSSALVAPPNVQERAAAQPHQPAFKNLDDHQAFNEKLRAIRNDTKMVVKRGLPADLAEALRLDEVFDAPRPLSKVGLVLAKRLNAPNADQVIKDHMADVQSISDAIGNSPSIPDSLFDNDILNKAIADKALDLAFHQKTRVSAPESYEKELTKIVDGALYKAMVGRVGRDVGLDANRTNAIKGFISALELKGASATGDTAAALQTLKQATEIFGGSAVASYAKWGMGQSQRRHAIAQSVVGYVQYLTGSSDDASRLIKEMIKKPATGNARPGSGELTDVAKEQLNKLGHSLVQLVNPRLNVHRNSDLEKAFKNLVEGSLVASGVDSHSVQRAREPGKQVQKPIVLTARSMAVKESDNPASNKGFINTYITRVGLPVMRDDTAGRALKIQRTLQANIAKSLMFDETGFTLNRVNEMIEQSTSCAQLYQIGLLVAVAAGERRLATRAGTALLEKSFELEKRSAVGAKTVDKQALTESVRLLMSAGEDSLSQGLHTGLNTQVTARGAYSADEVANSEREKGKVDFFGSRKKVRREAQGAILDREPVVVPDVIVPVRPVVPVRQASRFDGMNRFNRHMRAAIPNVLNDHGIVLTDAQRNNVLNGLHRGLGIRADADRINLAQLDEDALSARIGNELNALIPDADEVTRNQLRAEIMGTFLELSRAPAA